MVGTVAQTIQGEAGSDPANQFAVAATISNRLNAGTYGSSAYEIVNAPNQYVAGNGVSPNSSAVQFANAIENGTLGQYGQVGNAVNFQTAGSNTTLGRDPTAVNIGGNNFSDNFGPPTSAFIPPSYGNVDPNANTGTGVADTGTITPNTFGFDPTLGNTIDASGNPTMAGISPDTTQVASGDGTVTGASNGTVIGTSPSGTFIGSGGLTYIPSNPEQSGKAPAATISVDVPDVGTAIQGGLAGLTAQIAAYGNKALSSVESYFGNFALRGGVMVFAVIIFLAAAWLMVPRETKMQVARAAL